MVDRDILLRKLDIYGFRGKVNDFLSSYLNCRSQYVSVNGFDSNVSGSRFGVPQGSVLGPLLFNLFINDISKIKNVSKILFANDAVMYQSDPNLEV